MGNHRLANRSLLVVAAALLAAACGIAPLQPDRQARAPRLDGFGTATLAVQSPSAEARQLFAQGMGQAYGFNEREAQRSFKAALALDPDCAMCAWGVAWQMGPNINWTERQGVKDALPYLDHALRRAATLPPRDRELIGALALRYAHASEARNIAPLQAQVCGAGAGNEEKADPLDIAYAERMRLLADRYPDDPDVLSLYAEAELIATRVDWWDERGQPAGRIGELADKLEAALTRQPRHTGLNHYLIHTVDDVHQAGRAEAAADRLGALAPKSPRLLHMPSHTYAQIGRYADAERVNAEALAADEAMRATLKQQGFTPGTDWRGHNGNFRWYAALMQGRGELALQVARANSLRGGGDHGGTQPLLTLMRLERWDELLREAPPAGKGSKTLVLTELARGTALARLGRPAEAREALARMEPAAAMLNTMAGERPDYMSKQMRGIAGSAQARLRAEIASAEGRHEEALGQQALAITAAKDIDGAEPPLLAAGNRLALGDMQLRARDWAAAEQSFRRDLAEHPQSGWALRGLSQALQAQDRRAEADAARAALASAWAEADAGLRGPL
ncbi:hypothetical protein [Roseateles violae]|uniref:Tetratricopeptide repeat protein n=1 Tax=Roseateles violae TaxID=3058042 RepID=A0ABT8DW98_9BURK|nr:hypothetical protein [Pelomonas sp. PFR6]MDN3922433.1 hypothetical protein [Pelomonas sp. PFR6]